MWTSDRIPSYLHRWGSTEDMIVSAHYSSTLPRHERRRSSLVSYHEESHHHHHPHRKRRRSEDSVHSLKHLPRVVCGREYYEDELRCFSRDEVINFIDETPLPSPRRSPRRSSTISLIPNVYDQHAVALPHFPLTDFECEPQALRRLSEQRRSGSSRGSLPEASPKQDRGGKRSPGACGSGKGSRERLSDGRSQCEGSFPGCSKKTQRHSRPRTGSGNGAGAVAGAGAGAGADWPQKKRLSKAENKGSTNSFISTPSVSSSGYVTLPDSAAGSTTQ